MSWMQQEQEAVGAEGSMSRNQEEQGVAGVGGTRSIGEA